MAIDDARGPGPTENPIQLDLLPKEERALQFPVVTGPVTTDRQFARDVMLCLLLNSTWILLLLNEELGTRAASYLPWVLMLIFLACSFDRGLHYADHRRWNGLMLLAGLAICSLFIPILNPFGLSLWVLAAMLALVAALSNWTKRRASIVPVALAKFSLPVGSLGLVLVALNNSSFDESLPWICAGLLTYQGVVFRQHVLKRATIGMLDPQTVATFRRYKRLPTGLTPAARLPSFISAVRCFLSYNRSGTSVPGLFQSPAGSVTWRLATVTLTVSLMTIACLKLSFVSIYLLHLPPLTALCLTFGTPVLAVAAWLFVLSLFTWSFVGRAHALRIRQVSPSHWRRMLDQLDASPNTDEQESLWLGNVEADNSPILYPTDKLFTHTWVTGASGSGKTAWLMALVDQVIYRTDIRVVVVDCKAHKCEMLPVMQRAAQSRAAARNRPTADVRHFTLSEGKSTFLLDMFSQSWWKNLPVPQRAGTILTTFSMNYANVYGATYFRDAVYDFTAHVLDQNPGISSWREFVTCMYDAIRYAKEPWELSRQCKEDAEHVVRICKRLASLSALNASSSYSQSTHDNAIDFLDGHYYFALNARENGLLTGEVGRLITACVLAAAYSNPGQKILLVLDEWQLMVTRELEELLTQARDLGVGCVLANQNVGQLQTKDVDLLPIVEGNAALQVWMKVTDNAGRDQLKRLGDKQVDVLSSQRHVRGQEPSITFSETLQDRIQGKLISKVASDARRFFIRITDNAGLACYNDSIFVAKSMFHQTKVQYEKATREPWPSPSTETLVNRNKVPRYQANSTKRQTVTPGQSSRASKPLGKPRP